ncbi:MAG: RNA-binding transcriptional accessory protein, partial [Erysipelotrichaceae bacterium]|nr:RNA-binding transcriptional accessory protein [Erysipelotrichaceae bacterium]
RATIAKENGLEPLADIIFKQQKTTGLEEIAKGYLNENVKDTDKALQGAMDIIAETISDDAELRKFIREYTYHHGTIATKAKKEEDSVYRTYYEFLEAIKTIPSHRILAINRGEKEEFLTVKINVESETILDQLQQKLINKDASKEVRNLLTETIADSYQRLIAPSIANNIRSQLTEEASAKAMEVFKVNLKNLLLQPPVKGKVVMGFDPAYRTGCKIAVVDDIGNPLDTAVVYPTAPQNKTEEAARTLTQLISKYHVDIISIGNGTASKESEIFVADLLKKQDHKVEYVMTNEAGASVYSASKLAIEEFPQYDLTKRSAISIARRVQDPLAELVKIDPKAIGVGQYQHDMNQKELSLCLDGVVENCVSSVGADLNTASVSLLSHIAGISSKVANNIASFREKKRFTSRSQLLEVSGIGEMAFQQMAGFLRIPESDEPLDNSAVHPESYSIAYRLLEALGYKREQLVKHQLDGLMDRVKLVTLEKLEKHLNVGKETLSDIISELIQPNRDPRDSLPKIELRTDVMDISSLKEGMILKGTVRNVTDFGAFVDIGVHQDGLIHISKLSKRYVKNPTEVVSIGDIVEVKVLEVDVAKKRISLQRID